MDITELTRPKFLLLKYYKAVVNMAHVRSSYYGDRKDKEGNIWRVLTIQYESGCPVELYYSEYESAERSIRDEEIHHDFSLITSYLSETYGSMAPCEPKSVGKTKRIYTTTSHDVCPECSGRLSYGRQSELPNRHTMTGFFCKCMGTPMCNQLYEGTGVTADDAIKDFLTNTQEFSSHIK